MNMLKAKQRVKQSKGKQAALKEVLKEDNVVGMFVKIPTKLHRKLNIERAERGMTLADLVIEKLYES